MALVWVKGQDMEPVIIMLQLNKISCGCEVLQMPIVSCKDMAQLGKELAVECVHGSHFHGFFLGGQDLTELTRLVLNL